MFTVLRSATMFLFLSVIYLLFSFIPVTPIHESVKEKQKDLLTLLQNNTDWLVISRLSKRHYFEDIQKSISNQHIYFTTLTTFTKVL